MIEKLTPLCRCRRAVELGVAVNVTRAELSKLIGCVDEGNSLMRAFSPLPARAVSASAAGRHHYGHGLDDLADIKADSKVACPPSAVRPDRSAPA